MSTPASRPIVVDLAYGRPAGLHGPAHDVRSLLDAVDEPTVDYDGMRLHIRQAWVAAFARLVLHTPHAEGPCELVVGHPSTWGPRRAAVFGDVGARGSGIEVTVLPRALLIARSHSDPVMRRCAVVETTHLPTMPTEPGSAVTPFWDVQILRRSSGDWAIERSAVLHPAGGQSAVEALLDDSVEAIFVDGADRAEVDRALELVTAHTIAGRVVPVDRDLVVRYGHRTERDPDVPRAAASPMSTRAAHARTGIGRRVRLVAAGIGAIAVLGGAVVVGFTQRDQASPRVPLSVTVGRTTLNVPAQWARSDQSAPGGWAPEPSTTRTQFVGDGGQRVILVQTEVRRGSTRASVANSIRNRLTHRAADVVSEFSENTLFAGREVISYRETPDSGAAIRWYVVVAHDLQVSLGCQAGDAAEPVDDECLAAVGSVSIAPAQPAF